MNPNRKRVLDAKELLHYQIPEGTSAFLFELDKVIEERCDEFEYELETEGYIVVERDYISIATSIFDFKVIAYK